jgi:hypothetical protein
MPALRRPDDRHRGLRARLRAKVAADPKHDPHIMSKTACERRRLPVPLRWPHAGGDLSRRNHANQRADRPLIRSTPPPRSLLRASRPRSPPYPGRPAPASRPPSNPHSAGRPHGAPKLPRLRALALFGPRPPEQVAPPVMPASKNLHSSSLSTWRNKCGQPRRAERHRAVKVVAIKFS